VRRGRAQHSDPGRDGRKRLYALRLRDLIQAKAAQFLNPDIHRAGGFTAMLEIAHLAAAYDVRIGPHLVPELSVSVLVSIPNAALVEVLAGSPSNLWREPVEIVSGHMTPPKRPGSRHGVQQGSAEEVCRLVNSSWNPVYTENSDSGVLMVQSAQDRMRYDASRAMNRA
jgi:hypothetical protein